MTAVAASAATVASWTAVRATRNTPAVIPMPIASQIRIASSIDTRSLPSREPALECRELDIIPRDGPVRPRREVVGQRRAIDERREVRADRRRQLARVAEVRGDVGEVLDRIGMVALFEEGAGHPAVVPREPRQEFPAVADGAPQVRKVLILIGPVARLVPADVVKELVTRGELDLMQALVGLDSSGELDLVTVVVVAAPVARLRAEDPAPLAERADIVGEPRQRAPRQLVPRGHVHIRLARPPRPAE